MRNCLRFSIVFILFVVVIGASCFLFQYPNPTKEAPITLKSSAKYLSVEEPLKMFYSEFVSEAYKSGVDPRFLEKYVDDIVVYPLETNLYGLYSPKNRQIVLNSYYINSKAVIRKTLFHEIGHVYGLDHGEDGIMQTYMTPMQIYSSYTYEGEYDATIWDCHTEEMMSDIKGSVKYIFRHVN